MSENLTRLVQLKKTFRVYLFIFFFSVKVGRIFSIPVKRWSINERRKVQVGQSQGNNFALLG